jgi:hypothetical protein
LGRRIIAVRNVKKMVMECHSKNNSNKWKYQLIYIPLDYAVAAIVVVTLIPPPTF